MFVKINKKKNSIKTVHMNKLFVGSKLNCLPKLTDTMKGSSCGMSDVTEA